MKIPLVIFLVTISLVSIYSQEENETIHKNEDEIIPYETTPVQSIMHDELPELLDDLNLDEVPGDLNQIEVPLTTTEQQLAATEDPLQNEGGTVTEDLTTTDVLDLIEVAHTIPDGPVQQEEITPQQEVTPCVGDCADIVGDCILCKFFEVTTQTPPTLPSTSVTQSVEVTKSLPGKWK